MNTMSYLKKTSLLDFDESWRYGATLTLEELDRFDKLIKKVIKEFGEDSAIAQHIIKIRENYL